MTKILYAGSPEASAKVLEALLARERGGWRIAGALTNPPAPRGRGKEKSPTPVAEAAALHGIKIYEPEKLDAAFRASIEGERFDILVCFAYGRIFGPKFLALFKHGGVNLHPSQLPKYRGPSPVQFAIMNGERETAATIQRLAPGMDEGDILAQKKIALDGTETALSMLDRCADEGARLAADTLDRLAETGSLPEGSPQKGEPTYTRTLSKDDARIDWSMGAREIEARIRAFNPSPLAWTTAGGETLRVISARVVESAAEGESGEIVACDKERGVVARTGDGALALTALQRQGRRAMDGASFANGAKNLLGTVLR